MNSAVSRSRRFRAPALLAAAVALLAGLLLAPAPANAQTGNIVTFGDSYTAAPDQYYNHFQGSSGAPPVPADYPRQGACLQSPNNWPRQLGERTGLPVDDWSCTAETSLSMLSKIDSAIAAGDINPSTRAVYFAIGGNDFGPFGIAEGAPILDVGAMSDRYTHHMQQAAQKVRSVAPNAQLFISGYPRVTNGAGLCVIHAIPDMPLGIPVPGDLAEGTLRDMQQRAADASGMRLVDNMSLTVGHDTCSTDDSQRYVAGMIDFTSPDYTMAMHPTDLGHGAIAANNAAALGY